MQIIDIAICTDNIDPKGVGRVRYIGYNDYVSGKEHVKKYTKWEEDDPFIANPFLPNNINFIPEINQTIKIITYNTDKDTVNQEYIAGPFSTRYDFNSQTFSQQVRSTTYGTAFRSKNNIVNEQGEISDPKGVGAFAKNNHYSVSGKYGSDVLFTDDGIVLRGGKLISKNGATPSEKEKSIDTPLMAKNSAKLHLKKFGKKLTLTKEKTNITEYSSATLKYVIDYTLDDLTNPTRIDFYFYQIKPIYGDTFNSNQFTEFIDVDSTNSVLVNKFKDYSTPSFTIDLTTKTGFNTDSLDEKIRSIRTEIRMMILDIKEGGLNTKSINDINVKNFFTKEEDMSDIYPFYFRPTKEFRTRTPLDITEKQNKALILDGITLSSSGPVQCGLVWSPISIRPPSKTREVITETLKPDGNPQEQTFGSLTSDKIYLLSTDTNEIGDGVNFDKLNNYEYTQDDFLETIEPSTYALVRGEVLLSFLSEMYAVLTTHIHNINKPYARQEFESHKRMEDLFNRLQNELINKSIRIN